jgi:DNA-binding MarR family transcriptional regulator
VTEELVPGLRFGSHAQELWAALVAALGGWEARVSAAAAAAGLSPVAAWTLVQLDPDAPISQKELAARLRCNPSSVVDSTDRLEDAGLVDRRPNPRDRRVNVLHVTARGRGVRQRLIAELFEPPEAFRRLPARQLERFRDVMLAAAAPARPAPAAKERRPPPRRRTATSRP